MNFYDVYNLSFFAEKKAKELSLLQRKREFENFKKKKINDNIFQKNEIYFSISDRKKVIENINQQKSKIENSKNNPPLNVINYEKNIYQKSSDESFSSSDKNPKIKLIANGSKGNTFNKSPIKKDSFTSLKYFDIKKDLIKEHYLEAKNNNEIKVLKNQKQVYINTCLLNSYSTSRAIKKLNKFYFEIRKKRSSKYRGVSKNGNKWQVLIMINNKKYYKGSYPSEELAARIYDFYAIKCRGIKARTNFIYNENQLKKICEK